MPHRPSAHRLLLPRALTLVVLGAVLASCGGKKKEGRDLAALDTQLTTNIVDPAVREAIEAPIATDPDLTGESGRDTVRPADAPLTGTVPARLATPDPRAQARRIAGGTLIHAPAASREIVSTREPATLGARAAQQGGDACPPPRIGYAMHWAQRLPAAFPLYPGAAVTEAAGADNAPCNLRAVSFTTGVAPGEVLDFYATLARRAGYSIEHVEQNGAAVLGGTRRGSGAYTVTVRPAPGGGSSVDLVANGGR